jgi:DNA (cytosine-5)-methyltransferase 1
MSAKQFNLDLHAELIVDNFAGGGGASTGIELALGRSPDLCWNHDPEAVAMHQANHPQTKHFCQDVFDADPVEACGGRPVGLAWFSPDCKHFSKAKGGKPRSKKIRGLAWVVVKWAATVRPRVIILENVEEFQTWGPLQPDGNPCPKRKGRTFANWCARLRNLGYAIEWRELLASNHGAPTIRKRLFVIARCDGRPIVWPEATHDAPDSAEVKAGRRLPWRTAAECIDWSLPCPSIFERARPLAPATCRRIAKGIMRYVVNNPRPFIVRTAHGEQSPSGVKRWGAGDHDLAKPLPTQPASNDFALVAPVLTEHANASTARVFDPATPLRTQCAQVKGGHFALVQAFLAKHYGGVVGSELPKPIGTVTSTDHHSLVTATLTGVGGRAGQSRPRPADEPVQTLTAKGDSALVAAHLSKFRGTSTAQGADEPMHTVIAQGNHIADVRAFLVKYYGNEKEGHQFTEPLGTVTTKDRFGLVTVNGEEYAIADIGLRMLAPRELFRAQGFPDSYIIGDDGRAGLKLTKSAQVRMCGNSVCPPLAAALVKANVPELAAWTNRERRTA